MHNNLTRIMEQRHSAYTSGSVTDTERLTACHQAQTELQQQLRALQQQWDQLAIQDSELRAAIATRTAEYQETLITDIFAALNTSLASLFSQQTYFQQLDEFATKRNEFMLGVPDWEMRVATYRKLEEDIEPMLLNIPPLLRDDVRTTLKEKQAHLRQSIAPLLALEAHMQQLRSSTPLVLQVLVVEASEDASLTWLLPFPADQHFIAQLDPSLLALISRIVNCFGHFGKSADWIVDSIELADWAGFSQLVAHALYSGAASLGEATATLLTDLLKEASECAGIEVQVAVTMIPPSLWVIGQQRIGRIMPPTAPVTATLETQAVPTNDHDLEVTSQGWYSSADLRAWLRKETLSTPQQRRLCTLLTRMVGYGAIGTGPLASVALLCDALPPTHAREMRLGLDLLINQNILLHTSPDTVVINPEYLDQVQALIINDGGTFWSPLVAAP